MPLTLQEKQERTAARVDRVVAALAAGGYLDEDSNRRQIALADILIDLQHYAMVNHLSFRESLNAANNQFDEEVW